MKQKYLILGIIIVLAISILLIFEFSAGNFLKNRINQLSNLSLKEPKIPIRGVFINNLERFDDKEYINSIKDLGANWVEIVLWVLVTEDGEMIPYDQSIYGPPHPYSLEEIRSRAPQIETLVAQRIQQAHNLGFKVFLCTYHERLGAHHQYGREMKINVDDFLAQAEEIAIRWAKIAQDNKVEMYAPRKELQKFIGQKQALAWDDKILPGLRNAYKGDLVRGALVDFANWDGLSKQVWQGEELPDSFAGWDYLGVDFYGSGTDTFADLSAMYAWFNNKVLELKEQNNLKGVVFEELAEPHRGTESYWNDNSLSGNDVFNRLYQIYFEGGADSITGFFPWIWEEEGRNLPSGKHEHIAPNKIIKQYYTASAIPSYSGPIASLFPSFDLTYEVTKTLLEDDFDHNFTNNWELHGDNVSLKNGMLTWIGHERATLKDQSSLNWQNYIFKGKFLINDGTGIDFHVRSSSDSDTYSFNVRPLAEVQLVKPDGQGSALALRTIHYLVEYNKWYNFTIIAKGDSLQFFIDKDKVLEYANANLSPQGTVSFDSQSQALIDEVVIEEIR